MTEDTHALKDQTVLDTMIAGIGADDVAELLASLEQEITVTHDLIGALLSRHEWAESDWRTVEVKAHALKSAAASFGAMRLSIVCFGMEQNAHHTRDKNVLADQYKTLSVVVSATRHAYGWFEAE